MNEGTLLGRISSVSGTAGFMPHIRLPLSLTYHGPMTEALDVIDLSATACLLFASQGRLAQDSGENYIGSSFLDAHSTLGSLFPGGSGTSWTFLVGGTRRPRLTPPELRRPGFAF